MKVLIADDHRLVREGLKPLLAQIDRQVQVFEAWDAAGVEAAARAHPDLELALVDLDMPGMQGARSIAALRESFPSLPLIVLSAHEDAGDVQEILRLGASGYIPKTASADVTRSAIRLVLSGGQYLPPLLLCDGVLQGAARPANAPAASAVAPGREPGAPPGEVRLSPRQQEVLRLLSDGMSNKMIARELGLSLGTIKTHMVHIFHVLGVHNRTSAVLAARARVPRRPAQDER